MLRSAWPQGLRWLAASGRYKNSVCHAPARGLCSPIINDTLPKVVEINVGGTRFAMLRETLQKSPRLVREFERSAQTGHMKDGLPFIDRDPAIFPNILAYMRTGKMLPPKDTIKLTELLWEAKYYELQSLEKQLLRTTFFTRLLGDFASNPFESARTLMSRVREFATLAAALAAGWTAFVAYTSQEFPKLKLFYEKTRARLTNQPIDPPMQVQEAEEEIAKQQAKDVGENKRSGWLW